MARLRRVLPTVHMHLNMGAVMGAEGEEMRSKDIVAGHDLQHDGAKSWCGDARVKPGPWSQYRGIKSSMSRATSNPVSNKVSKSDLHNVHVLCARCGRCKTRQVCWFPSPLSLCRGMSS